DVAGAAVDLEDAVAGGAEEVVVMVLAGDLVAGRTPGDLDGRDVAGLGERVDGPVDGRETEARHVRAREVEDLDRAERSVGGRECADDGAALARGPHGR